MVEGRKAMIIQEYFCILVNIRAWLSQLSIVPACYPRFYNEALYIEAPASFLIVFPSDKCKFAVNWATYAHAIKVPSPVQANLNESPPACFEGPPLIDCVCTYFGCCHNTSSRLSIMCICVYVYMHRYPGTNGHTQ